jgi:hypothetical protein
MELHEGDEGSVVQALLEPPCCEEPVLVVALIFLVVVGATEDLAMASLVAIVLALVLLLSVVGPSWWERRGRTR